MKKTYYVLSVDGKLDQWNSGAPRIFYGSDPEQPNVVNREKFANADAIFIPVEVELPEADALVRRHHDEKNAIIGALRDNATPTPKTPLLLESRILQFLSSQGGAKFTSERIASKLGADPGLVIMALCNLVKYDKHLRGERAPECLTMVYWYEVEKLGVSSTLFDPPKVLVESVELYLRGIHHADPTTSVSAATIAKALAGNWKGIITPYEVTCALDKLVASGAVWRRFSDAGIAVYQYRNSDERTALVDPPEKIVLDYLKKTRGEDSSPLWQSPTAISKETELDLSTVEDVVERQCSTGAVMRQRHISGYLYRCAGQVFALTPTVSKASTTYDKLYKALKGNKYLDVPFLARAAECTFSAAQDVLGELEKDGKARQNNTLWKRPFAKKPCRVKAQSWREAVIQTLDAQKRPVTEGELEKIISERYPSKVEGGKSVHGAVGSAVHALKYTKKHKRFRFEKRSGKVVMWTVPVKHA